MEQKLSGKRVAFLATDGVEEVEFTQPWQVAKDAGAEVELVSSKPGEIQAVKHGDKSNRFPVDRTVEEVRAEDYDALVIPGGVGNPDTMRMDENAVQFVRDFFEQGKPVGVICHGPWQITATGLPAWKNARTNPTARGSVRIRSGFATPPGITSAS